MAVYPGALMFRNAISPMEINDLISKKYEGQKDSPAFNKMLSFLSFCIRGFFGYYVMHSFANDARIDADMVRKPLFQV